MRQLGLQQAPCNKPDHRGQPHSGRHPARLLPCSPPRRADVPHLGADLPWLWWGANGLLALLYGLQLLWMAGIVRVIRCAHDGQCPLHRRRAARPRMHQ